MTKNFYLTLSKLKNLDYKYLRRVFNNMRGDTDSTIQFVETGIEYQPHYQITYSNNEKIIFSGLNHENLDTPEELKLKLDEVDSKTLSIVFFYDEIKSCILPLIPFLKRTLVLDIETTGILVSEGDRLIEVGVIDITADSISDNNFHDYYNPEIPITSEAYDVHGYTTEFLKGMPVFKEFGLDLLEFVSGHRLIMHNAFFDIGFINKEIEYAFPNEKLLHERCEIIDSLSIARALYPNGRCSIRSLKEKFNIDTSNYEEYQPALLSAVEIAQVYLHMLNSVRLMNRFNMIAS